jgi:GntR family transcriptional regulator, transcriptional repressor for pyruvate dehydrogenase complex
MSVLASRVPTKAGTTAIRPFSPVSRLEEVGARIKEYIATNELLPGDRLPGEPWFAAQLGVGRPLVREALKGLEAVGVIEARKGIGRFVRAFEAGSYLSHFTTQVLIESFNEREIIETRCLLEIAAVGDAVERLTDDDRAEIERLWARISASAARGDSDTASDLGLHRVIMSRADNRFIVTMLDAVYALAVRRGADEACAPDKLSEDLAQHEAIVRAALARDGRAARAALIAHFETTAARLGFVPSWRNFSARELP